MDIETSLTKRKFWENDNEVRKELEYSLIESHN